MVASRIKKNFEQFDLTLADYIFCPWPKQPCALSDLSRSAEKAELDWLFRQTGPPGCDHEEY